MAGSVLTYSPSDVKLVVAGYTLGGIMDISVVWSTPPFSMRRGIRGRNTRVYNRDLSATLTINVQQTSVTNDVLFQILRNDRREGVARLDLALSDNSGRSVLQTTEAYVSQYPDLSYSMGFNPRQWTFELLSITDGQLSGSADSDVDFFSSIAGSDLLGNAVGFVQDVF